MANDKNINYLLIFGGSIRLFIFIICYTHITQFPDSSGYIELSKRLSDFDLAGYGGQRSPGYPLLISLAFGNLYVLVAYQFVLGLCSSVLWYLALLKLKFSKRASFFISLFLTSLLNLIFFEMAVLVESLVLFLLSATVYILTSNYFENRSYKKEWLLGAVLGLLTLVKPFYAFLPFLIFGVYLLKNFRLNTLFSRKLIILIFPLFAYFGWSYVNNVNTGYFVSTTFFGLNTAQNCVRFAEKAPEKYNWISKPYVTYREKSKRENRDLAMAIWYAYNDGAFKKYDLDFPDFSNQLGQFAKATIAKNPVDYAKQVILYSWANFWKPSIKWNYDQFNFNYANKVFLLLWYVQSVLLWIFRIAFLLLIPFYFFRALKTRKLTVGFVLMAIVFAASILQAVVTYGTNSRFSFPFEFMMIMTVLLFLKNAPLSRRSTLVSS